jgi:Trk K+ transport system NAD-binding subunit
VGAGIRSFIADELHQQAVLFVVIERDLERYRRSSRGVVAVAADASHEDVLVRGRAPCPDHRGCGHRRRNVYTVLTACGMADLFIIARAVGHDAEHRLRRRGRTG